MMMVSDTCLKVDSTASWKVPMKEIRRGVMTRLLALY